MGDCANATAPLEEAIAIAREVANADDIGRGYVNLCEAKHYCGDIRGAIEIVREGLVAADEVGINRTYGAFIRSNGVAYAFDLGEWDEARQWAEESIATVQLGRTQRRYGLSRWLPFLVARATSAPARSSTSSAPSSKAFLSRRSSTTRTAPLSQSQPSGAVNPLRRSPRSSRAPGDPAERMAALPGLFRVGMRGHSYCRVSRRPSRIVESATAGSPRHRAASATRRGTGCGTVSTEPRRGRAAPRASARPARRPGRPGRRPSAISRSAARAPGGLCRDALLRPPARLLPFAQLEAVRDAVRADECAVRPVDTDLVGDGHALPNGLQGARMSPQ